MTNPAQAAAGNTTNNLSRRDRLLADRDEAQSSFRCAKLELEIARERFEAAERLLKYAEDNYHNQAEVKSERP